MKRSAIKRFRDLDFHHRRLLRFVNRQPRRSAARILAALALAERAHLGQRREEGDPYIIHPIRIANILQYDLKITDADLIVAALLHDVVEDSRVASLNLIKTMFGARVGRLVKNLTRPRPARESEAHKKIWKARKLESYWRADAATRLIKSADFLDNIRSWTMIPKSSPAIKKFSRWLAETEKYYLPLARATNRYLAKEIDEEFQTVKLIAALHRL